MKTSLLLLSLLLIFLGATMLSEQPAYAYADPGTGLLAIQAAGSALIATGWYLRRKIYAFMHRESANKPEAETFSESDENKGTSLS